MGDAETLLAWRNDIATRGASHNREIVRLDDHLAWLSATLENQSRQLFIAEENGQPVGTVRADFSEGVTEISWTDSPSARGRGVAKRMVATLVDRIGGPIRAEIKETNLASIKVAEFSGMRFERREGGILHYSRAAV